MRTDITRFYSSIYTHTVPWALLGKTEAKSRFEANTLKRHWSDKLDRVVRKLNGNQTSGIPVGPDTSLVLAEALLGSVDERVQSLFPTVAGIRYIDDYEFVTQRREDAEGVLLALQSSLRELELELNVAKTTIVELPVPLTESWVASIRRHPEVSPQIRAHHTGRG